MLPYLSKYVVGKFDALDLYYFIYKLLFSRFQLNHDLFSVIGVVALISYNILDNN